MGVGDSLEASCTLKAPVPAGTWHFVGDGQIFEPITVRFELVSRSASGGERTLATSTHHFDPPPLGPDRFDAVAFDADWNVEALPGEPGAEIALRFVGEAGTGQAYYLPNGAGSSSNGRVPSLTLPRAP